MQLLQQVLTAGSVARVPAVPRGRRVGAHRVDHAIVGKRAGQRRQQLAYGVVEPCIRSRESLGEAVLFFGLDERPVRPLCLVASSIPKLPDGCCD